MAMRVVLCLIAIGCVLPAAYGGDLVPPGVPVSTMKTLQEVYDQAGEAEPRTAISSLPVTIAAPGSYYVTADLTIGAVNTRGITVEVDDVTIDLMGFTLAGAGAAAGSNGDGIYLSSGVTNVVIQNGTLRDWRNRGLSGSNASNCLVENLRCLSNGSDGVYGLTDSVFRNNNCSGNSGSGLYVKGDSVVEGNTCRENAGAGISADDGACLIAGNLCVLNDSAGILAGAGSLIRGNTCNENNQGGGSLVPAGIHAERGCTIVDNVCRKNAGNGIQIDSEESDDGTLVRGNTCTYNTGDGILVYSGCRVVDNVCSNNGLDAADGAGIHATSGSNIIEGNLVAENDRGIEATVANQRNLIIRNRADHNGTNYFINTSYNNYGEIIAAGAGAITSANPYANWEF